MVVGLGFVVFLATSVIPKVLVTMTKAAPTMKVSLSDSYLIGSKILARADGKDNCLVNVFVLDDTGKGIKGRQVSLSGMGNEELVISGEDGKAEFKMVSEKEGQFVLEASIDGIPLQKTMKVTFRN